MPTQGSSKPGTFQPGKSGNPNGRPKMPEEIREVLRTKGGPRAIDRLIELMESEDGMVAFRASSAVADRVYGRPDQPITGAAGGPLQVSLSGNVNLSSLSDEEFNELERIAHKAAAGTPDAGEAPDAGDDPSGAGAAAGGEGAP